LYRPQWQEGFNIGVGDVLCVALSSEVTFPQKKSAHRKVKIKRQLSAEGWPQSLQKAGLQLSPIWPPPEALLLAIALYCALSKEECIGEVASGRVCACSLRSRLLFQVSGWIHTFGSSIEYRCQKQQT
jgi:hypothetical protein